MKLSYDSQDFAVASRKAIVDRQPFHFEIGGSAWKHLQPHVVDKRVSEWAHLSAIPELQSFVAVMALAAVHDAKVEVSSREDSGEVLVGSRH